MTNEQLKGITDRARRIEANKPPNLEWQVVTKDIPAMIAEIKRLTVEQDAERQDSTTAVVEPETPVHDTETCCCVDCCFARTKTAAIAAARGL